MELNVSRGDDANQLGLELAALLSKLARYPTKWNMDVERAIGPQTEISINSPLQINAADERKFKRVNSFEHHRTVR